MFNCNTYFNQFSNVHRLVHKLLFIWKYIIVVTFASISCIDIVIHVHYVIHNEYVWIIAFCQVIYLKINPAIQNSKQNPSIAINHVIQQLSVSVGSAGSG